MKSKVVLDRKTSKGLGYGYISFRKAEDAEKCLKEMNNYVISGHAIILSMQTQKKTFNEKANILLKNLDKDLTQSELHEQCSKFGSIISCKLETYPDGASRCFAYVQFETEQEATAATEQLNGLEVKGKKVEVIFHQKKDKRDNLQQKYNNLFVKNFPSGTTEETLSSMFREFGELESVSIPKGENGSLKDFGYVCFKKPEDAEKAQAALNKKRLDGGQFLIVN